MVTKTGEKLPNDHIHREMIVDECDGCNKVWSNGIESFCKAYANPAVVHKRKGCFLKSNKEAEVVSKKKINPLKASKRARRKG